MSNDDLPLDSDTEDDNKLLDYITGQPVKNTPKEQVRQRISRALFHEYQLSLDDMEPDFKMRVQGKMKKIDIAIFEPDREHIEENLRRVMLCDKEPVNGKKGGYRLRDHEQAEKDLRVLKDVMAEKDDCRYGMWTNGLDFFFLHKEKRRFENVFQPIGDWPMADESLGTRDVVSIARMRRADKEMLRTAFRRCHNFIHGNEGMPKDAAFWQFLYLIFSKLYDEKQPSNQRRFWAAPTEQFEVEGRKLIRQRLQPLFEEVKKKYKDIFRGNEEISLSDRALAFMVSELSRYEFSRTGVDAKGAAYQEIVGTNLRGDRGQYFTPRGAIELMVQMLNPQPNQRLLDPACGTGGFLVATIDHLNKRFHDEMNLPVGDESTEEFQTISQRLETYAEKYLFGADFDPFLVKAAQMNVVMACNTEARLFHMNSLEFPGGHLSGVDDAKQLAYLKSMDLIMTNPPFGSDIPVTDPHILREFQLAHQWDKDGSGGFKNSGRLKSSVSPEVLFIERCVQWLKDGGRMGIVLPDGILGNPGDEPIRWWILRHCWVLASVDLPVEVFIVEANVNILTSLLFLKKKTEQEILAEDLSGRLDYPVFMAVAEKVGYDRRGSVLNKRSPDGEEITVLKTLFERQRLGGRIVERTLQRREKVIDNDLPEIAKRYLEFRKENPEPGK